jgi:hypothetical protein
MYDDGIVSGSDGLKKAAKFDGSSGIDVSQYDFSNVKAVSFWFFFTDTKNGYQTMIGSKEINSSSDNIKIAIAGSTLHTYHDKSRQPIGDALDAWRWYHLVISEVSTSVYNYYLDGVLVGENVPDNNASLDLYYIGADNSSGDTDEPFIGRIDQFRVFSEPLDAARAKLIYDKENMI